MTKTKALSLSTQVCPQGGEEWKPLYSIPIPSPDVPLPSRSGTEPLAVWSLVLGIISILGCSFATGIPAVICGHIARSRIKGASALRGAGMALAGLITAYIGMAITIILIAAFLITTYVIGTKEAEANDTRRIAQNMVSLAAAARASGYVSNWKTKDDAIKELRAGITSNRDGAGSERLIADGITDEDAQAASKHLELANGTLQYVP